VPGDVSLACTDGAPDFAWCQPTVAHICWGYRSVLRRVVRWVNNVTLGKQDRIRWVGGLKGRRILAQVFRPGTDEDLVSAP